jgi:hypothetical protein
MAPPRLNTPWVKRSIGFLPEDVEMLEAVRSRLGEPDGSAAIRRLIRDAFNGAQATHLPVKPVKPASGADNGFGVEHVPPSPLAWPSGILIQPHHTSDPGVDSLVTQGETLVSRLKPASEAPKHPFSTTFAKAVVVAVEKPVSKPEKRPSVAYGSRLKKR